MARATRFGDKSTGHDACAPQSLITASSDVRINGVGAGRQGDQYAAHGCVAHPSHQDVIDGGSSSVRINRQPAARIGDAVSIGGTVAEGSSDVYIGG